MWIDNHITLIFRYKDAEKALIDTLCVRIIGKLSELADGPPRVRERTLRLYFVPSKPGNPPARRKRKGYSAGGDGDYRPKHAHADFMRRTSRHKE
jgi:hypothetical protein